MANEKGSVVYQMVTKTEVEQFLQRSKKGNILVYFTGKLDSARVVNDDVDDLAKFVLGLAGYEPKGIKYVKRDTRPVVVLSQKRLAPNIFQYRLEKVRAKGKTKAEASSRPAYRSYH